MSATDMPHLFAGEVQFRRYSDTSTQGQQIVLSLADREALQPFIGLEGKRLMAVFVLIGDDEQPEAPPVKAQKPLKEGPRRKLGRICEWLVYRCKEPAFQQWIRAPYDRAMGGNGKGWGDVHPDHDFGGDLERYARHAALVLCNVSSRSEIDGNADAEARFESLIRKPWAAHTKAAERHAVPER